MKSCLKSTAVDYRLPDQHSVLGGGSDSNRMGTTVCCVIYASHVFVLSSTLNDVTVWTGNFVAVNRRDGMPHVLRYILWSCWI
jgi:hypothetical protein